MFKNSWRRPSVTWKQAVAPGAIQANSSTAILELRSVLFRVHLALCVLAMHHILLLQQLMLELSLDSATQQENTLWGNHCRWELWRLSSSNYMYTSPTVLNHLEVFEPWHTLLTAASHRCAAEENTNTAVIIRTILSQRLFFMNTVFTCSLQRSPTSISPRPHQPSTFIITSWAQ